MYYSTLNLEVTLVAIFVSNKIVKTIQKR